MVYNIRKKRSFYEVTTDLRDVKINNTHDKSYKDLYSNKEIFLDLIQGMLKAPWDVPTRFKDIVNNNDLFDVNNKYSKQALLNIKNVTSAIFLLDQKIDPQEFLQRIKAILEGREEGRKEGKEKGREEGAILARKEDIFDNLKDIADIPDDIIAIINTQNDIVTLKQWSKSLPESLV